MKVLVVGGAGYIGSHVNKALLAVGAEVTVFDNLSTGLRSNVLPGICFREGDILDAAALEQACSGERFDGVIHLAALKNAGESMLDPEKYSVRNISGSINILNAALRHGIERFVFSSSAAVYGEPQYLPVDEKHPTRPENYYGFTKLAIEDFLNWYARLKGLKFAALRYFNAAGYDPDGQLTGLEQNPANLLPVIMETAMGWRPQLKIFGDDYDTPDGTGVRDYVHVSDLAAAHVLALQKLYAGGESFTVNLGSEAGISVLEMVRKTEALTGKALPFEIVPRREGDAAKMVASSAMAGSLLGWRARHSDAETLLRTTWNAYQAHAATRPKSSGA